MHPFYGPGIQFMGEGYIWWLGMASMILYLFFWAVVIIFAVRLFKKYFLGPDQPKAKEDTALSILRERYAKGEIDAEEFKQKKADLE